MISLTGFTFAEGIGNGRAVLIKPEPLPEEAEEALSADPAVEFEKFQRKSRSFSNRLLQILRGSAPDNLRDIFGAAAGFVSNAENAREIFDLINRRHSAVSACNEVLIGNLRRLSSNGADPEYDAELLALIREFIGTLSEHETDVTRLPVLKGPSVIVARDLTPASLMCLDLSHISAVVLEGGHASAHLGVLLRELQIPSVFGVTGATAISEEIPVLVDANNGAVLIDPPQETIEKIERGKAIQSDDLEDEELPYLTIAASVGAMRELSSPAFIRHGLGLLRSEFLFLACEKEPSCEEMRTIFAQLFSRIPENAPVTARTFDFAGDKRPLFELETDDFGPLAHYGARVSTPLLRKQLRAMLTATPERSITIVFPLITRGSECRYLKDLIEAEVADLTVNQVPYSRYEIALMIETPGAVLTATALTNYASRFIIGTSSLAEYASAPRPPDTAFTPPLAKMIALACKAAHEAGVPVGIAGRFATRVELLSFFLRLGISYFSVDGFAVPKIRNAAVRLDPDLRPGFDAGLYADILALNTGSELAALINHLFLSE